MPLIDAYIKCTGITGSYQGGTMEGASAKLEITHKDWSEIYSFNYDLGDKGAYPKITITKPVDKASNDLYLHFLKNRARELQKTKGRDDAQTINEINIEMCRWVDTNNDGIVDEFQVFLEYTFKYCRILDYDTDMDFEADEIPEENIKIGFREMFMKYWRPNDPTEFTWNFAPNK